MKLSDHWRLYILSALVCVSVTCWYIYFVDNRNGVLTIAFLDIGQGDAIFIEAPNGNQILVDGGPGSVTLRKLGEIMPFYDRTIDMIVVTNPDADHISGFNDVLSSLEIGSILEPGTVSKSVTYQTLRALVKEKSVERIIAQRGMRIVLDDRAGVFLTVLFPDRDVSTLKTNDGSIIAKLEYGDVSILLTGDAPEKTEKYLADLDGSSLHADLLKVGHHGSRTSTSDEFVSKVLPQYAVISAGRDNKYSHPHPEPLAVLEKYGVITVSTHRSGTVIFKTDGTELWRH